MNCPLCNKLTLIEKLTTNGVLVDYCPKCEGVWLDKGEIFYFTGIPAQFSHLLEEALKKSKPSLRKNPKTGDVLEEVTLKLDKDIVLDYCPKTKGIWLDKGELLQIKFDQGLDERPKEKRKKVLLKLPNLAIISSATIFGLYAILILGLIILANIGFLTPGATVGIGIIIAIIQFGLSPFIMDFSLGWFYKVKWQKEDDIPLHLRVFLTRLCEEKKFKFPRFGIIPDGSPNAFTYGHSPYNARLVITSGLMELLDKEELEAVIAHEAGHIVHWDMLVMTIAYIVPLIFYFIFRALVNMASRAGKSKGKNNPGPYLYLIAIGSYVLYIISQYIVLWFSRVREYYADRFAGNNVKSPALLASSLVKIGYGLAASDIKAGKNKEMKSDVIRAMGIFDKTQGKSLAVSAYTPESAARTFTVNKEALKGAMKWDLWNPWAKYYELGSTHPLIAKRIFALDNQAEVQGKETYINFDEKKPESYWDDFLVDFLVKSLPVIMLLSAILFGLVFKNLFFAKIGALLFASCSIIKAFYMYKGDFFAEMNVSSLLKKVKVSAVRPVPCVITGKVRGRGVPGLIYSEDFVLQDETGIIFVDYQQPLAIWNFLFGLLKAGDFIGREVTIKGWYRRAPVPYIEIDTLKVNGRIQRCYAPLAKRVMPFIYLLGALVLLFGV